MGGRRLSAALAAALAAVALAAFPGPAPASDWPGVPWTELLPAAPSSTEPQPGPVESCRRPSPRCIETQIRRMRHLRDRLGCDHRAVFATTYLELTEQIGRSVRERPALFADHDYLYVEIAAFANMYFDSVRAWQRGRPVPGAWRVAFEAAAAGDANGAQDMLLGINAHVQNDMPFVLASLGLREPDGDSRKPDHDAMNEVLNEAYDQVVAEVERRYDPIVGLTNSPLTPLDDAAGLELVRGWREGVWRNAERLLGARTDAERAAVARQIEANAALWARMIAAPQLPGHRAQRDAHCLAALGS